MFILFSERRLSRKRSNFTIHTTMKRLFTLWVALSAVFALSAADGLGLQELIDLLGRNTYKEVNDYLVNRGWNFYSSKTGSITWERGTHATDGHWTLCSVLKDRDMDFPSGIGYATTDPQLYLKIYQSLESNGFVVASTSVQNDNMCFYYESDKYLLSVCSMAQANESGLRVATYKFVLNVRQKTGRTE